MHVCERCGNREGAWRVRLAGAGEHDAILMCAACRLSVNDEVAEAWRASYADAGCARCGGADVRWQLMLAAPEGTAIPVCGACVVAVADGGWSLPLRAIVAVRRDAA
jgi:hypothetical protein